MNKQLLIKAAALALLAVCSSAFAESDYPATDFQPKVVYSDSNYKHDSSAPGVATPAKNADKSAVTVSSSEAAVVVSSQGGSESSSSTFMILALGAAAAGVFFFKNKGKGPKASSSSSYGSYVSSSAAAEGATGVERYLNKVSESSKTGVAKYLEQQSEVAPSTGVAKYVAKQVVKDREAAKAKSEA